MRDPFGQSACSRDALPRVFVVSNVELVAEGIHLQLGRSGAINLSGRGGMDARTVSEIAACDCNVVVLDFASCGSRDFAEDLVTQIPGIMIVGIAIGSTACPVADWAELGVVGFVDDSGTIIDVIAAIQRVSKGNYAMSPSTTTELVAGLINRRDQRRKPEASRKLTPRETQILTDLGRGSTNKEIARRLGISANTVKNHVHHILEKLEVPRREDVGRLIRAGQL